MSGLAPIRIAMMARYADITGVVVPQDPLPVTIEDKSIVLFPRLGNSGSLGRGRDRSMTFTSLKTMDVEYHRRIPYRFFGTVVDDVTTIVDTITDMTWGEMASGGSKFDGTVISIENVSLAHFGALNWNEWTFGARLEVSFTYLTEVSP